jgi:hypothetical protein
VRHQLRDALAVMREATAGQHHTTACVDDLAIGKQCAADPSFAQQAAGRFVGQQCHAKVQGAAQQARHQRVAIDQLQAATVQQQVAAMAQQALANMQRRLGRAGGVEEGGHVGAAGDAHAGQADDVQRWAQRVQPRPELATVEG